MNWLGSKYKKVFKLIKYLSRYVKGLIQINTFETFRRSTLCICPCLIKQVFSQVVKGPFPFRNRVFTQHGIFTHKIEILKSRMHWEMPTAPRLYRNAGIKFNIAYYLLTLDKFATVMPTHIMTDYCKFVGSSCRRTSIRY